MRSRASAPTRRPPTTRRIAKPGAIPAPSNDEREGIARVVNVVKLQDIQLVNLRCSRARKLLPDGQEVLLDIQVSGQHELADGSLVAQIKFRTKTVPPSLQADATFYLRYALSSAVTDRDAASFAKHNAVFNAWPYWRELVQSCALRMGLAPLTMPLLRA